MEAYSSRTIKVEAFAAQGVWIEGAADDDDGSRLQVDAHDLGEVGFAEAAATRMRKRAGQSKTLA